MARGSYAVIHGDVAPEGAVIKLTGHKVDKFEGPACVFDSEEDAFHAVQDGSVGEGDVIIIRYEGPQGGPDQILHVDSLPARCRGKMRRPATRSKGDPTS